MSTGQHKFQSFQTMTGASTRDQTIEERYGIPENFLEIEVNTWLVFLIYCQALKQPVSR